MTILPVAVGASMIFTSCKKSENAPVPSTSTKITTATQSISKETLSGKIAHSLASSLAGNYGGISLNTNMDSLAVVHNALCGLFTDSLVNYDYNEGDTVKWHVSGNKTFYFNCENGKATGYTAYDSTNSVRTYPRWNEVDTYNVKQYYTIKCFDDKHLFIGVNGDVYFYMTAAGYGAPDVANANYVLNNLKVDVCKRDILSGTATFVTHGAYGNYTGTITFLGNFTADVTIDGQTFQIDLNKYY